MTKQIIPISFILIVASLLVWQRFDGPAQEKAVITASTTESFHVGDRLHRGQTIETRAGEYVAFQVADVHIGMSEHSTLTLDRLFQSERVLTFPRGRIIVDNPSNTPLFLDTLKTQNTVTKGTSTFINFDFLQTVHIIPLKQSVQTKLVGTNEYLVLPVPIAVHETTPPTYETIQFDVTHNTAQAFYEWFDQI